MRAASLILLLPRLAGACSVCFNAQEAPGLSRAYTWGILMMLGCTGAILGVLIYSIWRLESLRDDASR